MHSPERCERCQLDTLLYGQAFFNGATDEHYDVPSMVIARAEAVNDRSAEPKARVDDEPQVDLNLDGPCDECGLLPNQASHVDCWTKAKAWYDEMKAAAAPAMENERPWRVGRKVGRTIYMQLGVEPSDADPVIGLMDSPEIAEEAVQGHNRNLERRSGVTCQTCHGRGHM